MRTSAARGRGTASGGDEIEIDDGEQYGDAEQAHPQHHAHIVPGLAGARLGGGFDDPIVFPYGHADVPPSFDLRAPRRMVTAVPRGQREGGGGCSMTRGGGRPHHHFHKLSKDRI